MEDIRKMARWQLITIVVFALAKAVRPSVLESQAPELVKLFLLSFPNFCEAIVGILTLTMLGLYANRRLKWPNNTIYIAAVSLAAIYVITQEFKIHNLGGNNIYDPNDVLFSVLGLLFGFILIRRMKPQLRS
ncbi:MAG: hypothetical protein F6K19_28005 [Cyanothece sp. SIO1E1]|nr:hypothetical protein [Cyanothece sp. SIO1E1]